MKQEEEEEEEEEDGEMDIFYHPSKIFKLVQFISIIVGTSKKHQRMPQNVFLSKFEMIKQVLEHSYFACVLLGIVTKFLVDPYYEPLSQFMICNMNN